MMFKKIFALCFCFCVIHSTAFCNELTDKALDQMNQNSIENQMSQKLSDRQWEEDQERLKERIRQNNEKARQQKDKMASDFAKTKDSFTSGTLSPETSLPDKPEVKTQEKFLDSFLNEPQNNSSDSLKDNFPKKDSLDINENISKDTDNTITERKQQRGTIKNRQEKDTSYYNPAVPKTITDSQVTQKKSSEWTDESYTKLLLVIIIIFIVMTILFFNGRRNNQ